MVLYSVVSLGEETTQLLLRSSRTKVIDSVELQNGKGLGMTDSSVMKLRERLHSCY